MGYRNKKTKICKINRTLYISRNLFEKGFKWCKESRFK